MGARLPALGLHPSARSQDRELPWFSTQISQVCQLCQQSPRLFSNHAAQLHTLLGLYCVSVNCMDNAEAQFTTALRLTNHQELWAFIVTNLASVYIREGNRHQEVVGDMLHVRYPPPSPVRGLWVS
ncbi:similar to KIAA0892 protein (predicted), isoform CRA_b [Rattus norvegicus]|uniref:Cohesin loading complex subunit SCC4 homolog n=1 Tax=Rattus norvegicus TaxID=10116 RepID=A6KA98_RAT|nr:similar to KIAA0892 protein (predicted), isoform CRA_b [Rattus norvegicus]